MNHQEATSIIEELQRWGFHPNNYCYCGCGGPTGSYFWPGDDSIFAARLLRSLEGNEQVRQAIEILTGNNPPEAA